MTAILIVEDDLETREGIATLLRVEGYPVETAENGRIALDWLLAGNRPALIILDLAMPEMDGWEFMNHFRTLDRETAEAPVVVWTAFREQVEGALMTIRKPNVHDLLTAVHEHYRPRA